MGDADGWKLAMSWDDWFAFWSLGGCGVYVWGAYLLAMVVILSEIVTLMVSRRSIMAHLGFFSGQMSKSTDAANNDVRQPEVSS